MKKYLPYLSEGVWIALGQALVALGALVGVRLLTEVLDPVAYGEVALGTTIATLINQTIFGPLGNGIARYYAPACEEKDMSGFLNSAFFLMKSGAGIVFAITTLASLAMYFAGYSHLIGMFFAFVVFATLSGSSGILNGIQNAARQRKIVAMFQSIDVWSRFLISATLVWLLKNDSTVAAYGYALASLFILCAQYFVFRRTQGSQIISSEPGRWVNEIWRFSWPFASWGVFTWARLASDRWSLQLFASKEEVGFYSVVFQLGYYPMSLVTGVVTQLFAPILYQRAGNAKDDKRNADASALGLKLTICALAVTGASVVVAAFFHQEIFHLLAAKEYAGVSYLLPWVILSGGIFAAAQLVGLNMMSRLEVHALILCTIATAVAGIAMNFIGVYFYGLDGTVGAGIVFSVMYFAWMCVLNKKITARKKNDSADVTALA